MTFISDSAHLASEREASALIPFEWNRIVRRMMASSAAAHSETQSFLL